MKTANFLFFSMFSLSLSAQIEITNLDIVLINDEMSTQNVDLNTLNSSNETIDFEWEIEFLNDSDSFLVISVSDINIDYLPHVLTSCDLINVENVLAPSESYQMGLHITITEEVPESFDRDSILAYFHLYSAEQCDADKLLSLPIKFNPTLSSSNVTDLQSFNLYPNPSTKILYIRGEQLNKNSEFEIFDLQSKRVMKGETVNAGIDVSHLSQGTYIIQVNGQSRIFNISYQ